MDQIRILYQIFRVISHWKFFAQKSDMTYFQGALTVKKCKTSKEAGSPAGRLCRDSGER